MTRKETQSILKAVSDREEARFAAALKRAMARHRAGELSKRGAISAEVAKPAKPGPDARCST